MKRTPLKRFGEKSSERKELDALLRQVVLLRDDFRCRRCGRESRAGRGGSLQAAHIKPKGHYPSLRYELTNVILLCASCHLYGPGAWHKDPVAAAQWALTHLGEDHIERLDRLAVSRGAKQDKAAIKLYLMQELARMQARALNFTQGDGSDDNN